MIRSEGQGLNLPNIVIHKALHSSVHIFSSRGHFSGKLAWVSIYVALEQVSLAGRAPIFNRVVGPGQGPNLTNPDRATYAYKPSSTQQSADWRQF